MKILFSNDDGYDAIGIQTLFDTFKNDHDSHMYAPLVQKSAFSHAINYADYLELVTISPNIKAYKLYYFLMMGFSVSCLAYPVFQFVDLLFIYVKFLQHFHTSRELFRCCRILFLHCSFMYISAHHINYIVLIYIPFDFILLYSNLPRYLVII